MPQAPGVVPCIPRDAQILMPKKPDKCISTIPAHARVGQWGRGLAGRRHYGPAHKISGVSDVCSPAPLFFT
jgi:hypothetical protein